jgi:RHS repeat-associated protein
MSGTMPTDKQYTGQQVEPGDPLGLYNYRARMYSTVTGRFTSADTWTGDGLNRYTYTRNNPLAYRDATGHGVTNADGTSCPPTRPDCENDGGPPPVGGNGGDCDLACQWQSAAAYCSTNPGDSCCGGPFGPTAPGAPSGSGSPSMPLAAGGVAGAGVMTGMGEGAGLCEAITGGGCTPLVAIGALLVTCYFVCPAAIDYATADGGSPGDVGPDGQKAAPVPPPTRSPAQDKLLTPGDIQRLKDHDIDPESVKDNNSGQDLYKDRRGDIYVKPKGGAGPGEPTGININDLEH